MFINLISYTESPESQLCKLCTCFMTEKLKNSFIFMDIWFVYQAIFSDIFMFQSDFKDPHFSISLCYYLHALCIDIDAVF